jgi:hypothetical protein
LDKTLVSEITNQILKEEILLNWRLWILMFIIWLISIAANNFISKYLEKRGEALATKADFNKLLEMLEKQTEATERIKSTISHEEWSLKENKLVRRQNLEELIETSSLLADYITKHFNLMAKGDVLSVSPIQKFDMLISLYFPELEAVGKVVIQKYHITIMGIELKKLEAIRDGVNVDAKSHLQEFQNQFLDFICTSSYLI